MKRALAILLLAFTIPLLLGLHSPTGEADAAGDDAPSETIKSSMLPQDYVGKGLLYVGIAGVLLALWFLFLF